MVVEGQEIEICGVYIPNRERSLTEKAEYWKWLIEVGAELSMRPVIICGDLNTGLPYVDENGSTLPSADLMKQMLDGQWTDLWRQNNPSVRESSWWSNSGNGFRIDHVFGSPQVAASHAKVEYLTTVGAQCIVHPGRKHERCNQKPLSDHSMLVVEV